MSILKNYLAPQEQLIDRIAPIKFKGINFDCAITNQRMILYGKDKKQFQDIKYESINQVTLEKEWYDEFFLGTIISLIIGIIWLVSGIVYRYIENPEIAPQIGVIRALMYPGLVLTCLGIAAFFIYCTRMKLHLQILTPQESFQLYSNQERLNNLFTIYKNIKSGDIPSFGSMISGIPDEKRQSEKPLATFDNIGVKITFKDESTRKKSINLIYSIIFTENFIQLTSKRLMILKNSPIFKKYFEEKKIPLITEENLYNIFTIAKDLQVSWVLLTNFNFTFPRSLPQNYHFLTGFVGSGSTLLIVESFAGQIALEFKKLRLFTDAPAQEIVEIEKFIRNHIKKQ